MPPKSLFFEKTNFDYCIAFGLALCLITVYFAEPLLSLYASKPAEIAAGIDKMHKVGLFVFIYASSDVAIGTLRGMGCSFTPMVTSLICVCGARLLWIATVFQLPQYHTVSGLYTSFPVSYFLSLFVQGICMVVFFRIKSKKYGHLYVPDETVEEIK